MNVCVWGEGGGREREREREYSLGMHRYAVVNQPDIEK